MPEGSSTKKQSSWPAGLTPEYIELAETLGRTPADLELAEALEAFHAENRKKQPTATWVPAEIVQTDVSGIRILGEFTTDDTHSFLRLKRVVVEAADENDDTQVSAKVLGQVRCGELRRTAEYVLGLRVDFQPERRPATGSGRRRETWTDLELTRLAKRYVELVRKRVRNPIVMLADEWRTPKGETVSVTAVRDAIREARTRGLLTFPKAPGVPGGELTPAAKKLLRKAKR
jgi:hypothetical protein